MNSLETIRAAILQFDIRKGDVEWNVAIVKRRIAGLAKQGVRLILLPEMWATGFANERLVELSENTPWVLEHLSEVSKTLHLTIIGSLPEKTGSVIYNTAYVVDRDGSVAGIYRKIHLFSPTGEDHYFEPGRKAVVSKTSLGPIGLMICYDLRFPELCRSLVLDGATMVAIMAEWPAERVTHWDALLKARAIENQMFVAACNRCGSTEGVEFGGHSMIVSPDGIVLAEAGDTTEYGGAQLDPALLEKSRSSFNSVAPAPYSFHDSDKIMEVEELKKRIGVYKKLGRKVVFTNGCFDLMHVGHVTYLETARKQGDCLIIGLNNDSSIRSIKGPDRPVNRLEDRARMLAALGCVDHVVVFDEDTPLNLIKALMPDVLVKGADWSVEEIVGAKEVMASGGSVACIPLVETYSSTSLIKRIGRL